MEHRWDLSFGKLILKGFRSLQSVGIEFDNPTFLVGRNGSGKSNIADAFSFLAEAMRSPLTEVFDRRGGIDNVLTKSPTAEASTIGVLVELDLGVVAKAILENFEEIKHGLLTNARYAFEVRALPDYRYEILREQCVLTWHNQNKRWFDRQRDKLKTNAEPFAQASFNIMAKESLSLPTLSGVLPFESVSQILSRMKTYSIEPAKLREMQDPDSGTSLRSDGGNAASVFEELERRSPQSVKRIQEFLSAIVPHTKSVDTIQHGKKLALEFTQGWDSNQLEFEAFNMSDGTLRAFGLLLAVFQRPTPSLIVVEEPEASMHPAASNAILDLMLHAATEMQVIVSTHSPEILDAKWIEDRHLRLVNWQEGATTVSRISEMSRKALQDHLMGAGELFRSEALEPTTLFEEVPERQLDLFEEVS